MHSVLFVCAANICRSPLAMGILREKTRQNADEDWLVESAGVWARQGDRIESLSQLVVLEKGIDLSAHRSRRISADLLHDFNLILTMEMGQKEAIKAAFPQFSQKSIFDIRDDRQPARCGRPIRQLLAGFPGYCSRVGMDT